MTNLVKYSCWFILLFLSTFSNGQIVDGFDYPFGNKGINDESLSKYYEQYIYGYNTDFNSLYPSNPCDYPRRESDETTVFNGWYSLQDVGTYYKVNGGLHSGEDWNHASKDSKGSIYRDDNGLPIYSIANGEVLRIGKVSSSSNLGDYIIIKHKYQSGGSIYSIYAHINISSNIKQGQTIEKGVQIGTIANISGPHLHFEIRTDIGFNEEKYFWSNSANSGWYYSDDKNFKRYGNPLTKDQTIKAFNLMKQDGLIDPSDFIITHRPGRIGVGNFKDGWRNDGVSREIFLAYIRNGAWDQLGYPYNSEDGYVNEYTFYDNSTSQQKKSYLQYFQKEVSQNFTIICYNPNSKINKAFLLKGCIGFLWWQKSNPNNIASLPYQNYLGLPVGDEEPSNKEGFEIMQSFEHGTIYWGSECSNGQNNVMIEILNLQQGNGCLACQPKTDLSVCDCLKSTPTKSASLFPDCDQFFSSQYLQKTSWDFGNEVTSGWTARNANDLGIGDGWYWMVDPVKDTDPISGSGIVSPPFLSSINTDLYDQVEIRAACKSQFMNAVQLHLLIDGEWKPPLLLNCVSPKENQLPNNQCVYKGNILYPGQIQQFRIDFIEGSDAIEDKLFIDYVKFIEGVNPVPTFQASYSSDVQFGKFPLSVKFTNSSQTKNITSAFTYEWDFGDGITSTDQSPTHVYTKPGEYSVSLKITSDIYNNSVIQTNYIKVFESNPVSSLEYFFDSDPGQGKGIAVNVSPSEDFSQSFDLDYSGLTEGNHTLFVRAKDGSGAWGLLASKQFYASHNDEATYITQMEYFFDNDPGFGKGTTISINYNDWEEQNFNLDFSGLNEGYHTLIVRTKNNQGMWGNYSTTLFYCTIASNPNNITDIEYYIDSDPGVGMATIEKVTPSQFLTYTISPNIQVLPPGVHKIGIRVKNGYSLWSDAIEKLFAIQSPPIADAGVDQLVNEGDLVTLDGTKSYSPDNDSITYHWTAPNGIELTFNSVANPNFIAPETTKDTTYTFSLTVSNGVVYSAPVSVKVTVVNIINVGLSSKQKPPLVRVYPNPSTGIFNIELDNIECNLKIEVYNSVGVKVYCEEDINKKHFSISLLDKSSGIYFMRIRTLLRQYTQKLQIQNTN